MKNELSILEKAVIEKLLEGDFPLFIHLKQQVTQCIVLKQEVTGFGFYTTLAVPEDVCRIAGLDIKFGDIIGDIPGLLNGAGFLLYVKNGVLDMLEGYSYDEPWPLSIASFSLKYVKGERRDLTALKGVLCQNLW